jgi:hypothetical protein
MNGWMFHRFNDFISPKGPQECGEHEKPHNSSGANPWKTDEEEEAADKEEAAREEELRKKRSRMRRGRMRESH